ncbi:MAG: 23S rRNA (adenine(2503)-C(2))-methyltransferase RlmN [Candidatus Firestonebacteria bacterium]|nr:23S rRNA (adenine(2503)-C(2))-methyltransferase RlmN [Candidatus Firestonebacteria bacterium]
MFFQNGATLISNKINICNLNHNELEEAVIALGLKKFIVSQIEDWIYKKLILSFSLMTNISPAIQSLLDNNFDLYLPELHNSVLSQDGTIKLVFKLNDGESIESVLIKEDDRKTVCISSQAGCAHGCKFCVTGKIGLIRNLKAAEIVGQLIMILKREQSITNIVFMGMGEPLANIEEVSRAIQIITYQKGLCISPRRITVSTCGVIPQLIKFNTLNLKVNLAISLNATTNKDRDLLMPINKKYPINELLAACHKLNLSKRQRIIFEYILIKGINDSKEDALRLVNLLKGIPNKINLIIYNKNPYVNFKSPDVESAEQFQQILIDHHYSCFMRRSKGDDINAACGQLSAGHKLDSSLRSE